MAKVRPGNRFHLAGTDLGRTFPLPMYHARTGPLVALLGVLFLSTIPGCRRSDGPAEWDVDVALPLLTTRFTIADILPDSLQSIGPDGAVTLVYRSELFAVDLDTLLALPDTNFVYPFAFPLVGNDQFNLPPGFPVISENNLVRFNLPEVELTRLDLRAGSLRIDLRNKIASRVLGSFSIPSAFFPGGNNTLSLSVGPGTPAAPNSAGLVRDLSGTRFDLRGPSFNDVNSVETDVEAQLDPDGSGATVTNRDSVIVEASYTGLVTAYAKGYFGNRSFTLPQAGSRLGLFDAFISGGLDLDRVALRLNVENGVGMDLQIRINDLQAVNSRTGVTVDMTHAILQGPVNIDRATDGGSGPIPSFYLNELDNSDSNVDAFVENMPDEVRYDVEVRVNPLGDVSNGNDFLYYESRLGADLELEVPLSVIATDLVLENITKPDLPGDAENQAIESGTLHLFANNGFPFSARVLLDIVDLDRNVLVNVPVEGMLAPGIMGPAGVVQASVESSLHARLTPDMVELLYGPGRLRTRIVFNTTDQVEHVRILDRYALDLQFTVDGTYIVNGDE